MIGCRLNHRLMNIKAWGGALCDQDKLGLVPAAVISEELQAAHA
jgi:hypothetical protein